MASTMLLISNFTLSMQSCAAVAGVTGRLQERKCMCQPHRHGASGVAQEADVCLLALGQQLADVCRPLAGGAAASLHPRSVVQGVGRSAVPVPQAGLSALSKDRLCSGDSRLGGNSAMKSSSAMV